MTGKTTTETMVAVNGEVAGNYSLFVFLTENNWCVDLTDMYSLRSKLTNIIIQGVFWSVVESLGGV